MQVIFHIDMNAFFASCELRQHPEYQNKPLIVAHRSRRGIVTTASYEARKYGIHSAMPTYMALEKCPDLIVVEPHFDLYRQTSQRFFQIVSAYSQVIEAASIDECYVDVSDVFDRYGGILETAQKIQSQIYQETGISCSIGISPNKFLAKMASDMKKPMGITVLTRSNLKEKLWPLSIDEMYGIGKKTAPKLKAIGIQTIGDLAQPRNFDTIRSILGNQALLHYQHANGIDFAKVDNADHDLKSVGHSITLQNDTTDETIIKEQIQQLTQQVSLRAKKHHLVGNHISLTLKYTRFENIVRSAPLDTYTNDYEEMIGMALMLFEQHDDGRPVRLIGVSLNNTINQSQQIKQLSLFDYQQEIERNHNETDQLLDKLNQIHQNSFIRASQLSKK